MTADADDRVPSEAQGVAKIKLGADSLAALWRIVTRSSSISPKALLVRLANALRTPDPDPRSIVLMRECFGALGRTLGRNFVAQKIAGHAETAVDLRLMQDITSHSIEPNKFPSILPRLIEPISAQNVIECLRDVSTQLRERVSIVVGGSSVLLLKHLIERATENIDVLDELPEELRDQHAVLDDIKARHRLSITHAASHYLPTGWNTRTWSLDKFGPLDVRVVDPIDLLVSKLFSKRAKDFRDVKDCWDLIDHAEFRQRLSQDTHLLRGNSEVLAAAVRNWFVLTGEETLPASISAIDTVP